MTGAPYTSAACKRDTFPQIRSIERFRRPWLDEQRGNLKLTSNYLSKLFAGIFEEAGCGDLHYHDLRREATSRLFERTTFPTEKIMLITGHKGHRMMMRYLRLRPSGLTDGLW